MKIVLFVVALLVAQSWGKLMSVEEIQQSVTVTDTGAHYARAFQANWWPTLHPRIVQLIGLNADTNAAGTHGEIDAVEFILNDILECALAFGYYHAEADITTNINGNGNSNFSASNITGAGFAEALRIFHVFEFVNNDGNPGFQNGTNDTVTGWYDLSSVFLTWNDINITSSNITANGTDYKLFICTVSTADDVFLIRFVAVGLPATVEGIKIDPNSIKVDIEIKWFGNPSFTGATLWSTGPSTDPNAQVGITAAFAAAEGTLNQNNNNNAAGPSLNVTTGTYTGYLTWMPTADITAGSVYAAGNVDATIVTQSDSVTGDFDINWIVTLMYFTFNATRPTDVVWDPTFGASVPSTNMMSSSDAISSSPMVALMVVCIAMLFMRKD